MLIGYVNYILIITTKASWCVGSTSASSDRLSFKSALGEAADGSAAAGSADLNAKIATLMEFTGRRSGDGGLVIQGDTVSDPDNSKDATEHSKA